MGLLLVTAFASYVIAAMVLGVFEVALSSAVAVAVALALATRTRTLQASMSVIVVSFCCEQDGRARSLQEVKGRGGGGPEL